MEQTASLGKTLYWNGMIAGIVPGIYLGFWIGQNSIPVYLAVLFGPLVPAFHLTDIAPACSTLLAFVCYLLCSLIIARRTGSTGRSIGSAMVAVGTTMLVSLIATTITASIVSGNIFLGLYGFPEFLPLFLVLVLAALLGGMIGSSLSRWRWRTARSEPGSF